MTPTSRDSSFWKLLAIRLRLNVHIAQQKWHAAYAAADEMTIALGVPDTTPRVVPMRRAG